MKDKIIASFQMERKLWEALKYFYGEQYYRQIDENRVYLKGMITRQHMKLLHQRKVYGHHGIWIDPQNAMAIKDMHIISGDLRVDIENRKVTKNGKILNLRPVEYDLLLCFMEHPNQILSRSNLIDLLESRHYQSIQDNTVSVHVHRLRTRLKDASYIQTHYMIGYEWTKEVREISRYNLARNAKNI